MDMSLPYQPHAVCLLGQPLLMFIHVASDATIFLAYTVISALLFQTKNNSHLFGFLRNLLKKGAPDFVISQSMGEWTFASFAMFIGACGLTHLMDIIVLWVPVYWAQGFVKVVTALASGSTAIILVGIVTAYLRALNTHRLKMEID